MFEYLSESSVNERRDVLREIDAGELNEYYLIKHTSDYGRHAATQPLNVLKTMIANWLKLRILSSRPKQIGEPVCTVSRSTAQ